MAVGTYLDSSGDLADLLAGDPNNTAIAQYLASQTFVPGHLIPTEIANGNTPITDVQVKYEGHSYQPMLLMDDEVTSSVPVNTFPGIKFVVEGANETLTTTGSKSGVDFETMRGDTLTASSSSYDTIDGSDGGNSIAAGSHDLVYSAGLNTIQAGNADLVYGGPGDSIWAGTGGGDTIWGSNVDVYVPIKGSDTISASGGTDQLFLAHTNDHVTYGKDSAGDTTVQFTNTRQTITFSPGGQIELHFAGDPTTHVLKP